MKQQYKNSEFYLKPQQIKKLIDAANKSRNKIIIKLFAYTAIRRAELCNIEVEDVDTETRRILIRNGKGGKQRIVFYPKNMNEELVEYLGNLKTSALFPGRNRKTLSLRTINNIVASTGYLARIANPNPKYTNITPHLLRHSLARNWKSSGGSLESLQKILGHTSLKTTLDVYGTESMIDTEKNYNDLSDRLVKE